MAFYSSFTPGIPQEAPDQYPAWDPRSQGMRTAIANNANFQQQAEARGGGWQGTAQAALDQRRAATGPQTQGYNPNAPVRFGSQGSASNMGGRTQRVTTPTGLLGTNLHGARDAGSVKSTLNDFNKPDKGGVVAGYLGPNPIEVERQRMAQRGQAMQDFSGKKSYALAGYMQGK